jgi:hypothetical protein
MHYVGIVVADSEDDVDNQLEPYSENNEVEPYFVELDSGSLERMK